MTIIRTALFVLLIIGTEGCAETQWFLLNECTGTDLNISVAFDGERIFEARGPACDEYENNIDGRWEKETLTFDFEPKREITWTGYREHPFNSPSGAVLDVDLWLAGAASDTGAAPADDWLIGVTVTGERGIYMNTLHIAALDGTTTSCIAEDLCIHTSTD